jgi:hypothetical protein
MKAENIAESISISAEYALSGHISLEDHSVINKTLWDAVRELDLGIEVNKLLQDQAVDILPPPKVGDS